MSTPLHASRTLLLALALAGCFAAPGYEGPRSGHFDGTHFRNQSAYHHHSPLDVLELLWELEDGDWDPPTATPTAPPDRVPPGSLQVTWVGHATCLVQLDGLNLLTDPVYSQRCSPVSCVGPERQHPPGVPFDDLPPIDLVVISHNHYDHLDLPTLERLAATHDPLFLVPLGNDLLLRDHGLTRVQALDWWDEAALGPDLRAVCVPAQHHSGRGVSDRLRTLWSGWVIQSPHGSVYFAGDTGWGPHFAQIRERFGPPRLALLPIGAYLPRWFMRWVHMDPAQAVAAHRTLRARTSLGIHYGTFPLGNDTPQRALHDLDAACTHQAVPRTDFLTLPPGHPHPLP